MSGLDILRREENEFVPEHWLQEGVLINGKGFRYCDIKEYKTDGSSRVQQRIIAQPIENGGVFVAVNSKYLWSEGQSQEDRDRPTGDDAIAVIENADEVTVVLSDGVGNDRLSDVSARTSVRAASLQMSEQPSETWANYVQHELPSILLPYIERARNLRLVDEMKLKTALDADVCATIETYDDGKIRVRKGNVPRTKLQQSVVDKLKRRVERPGEMMLLGVKIDLKNLKMFSLDIGNCELLVLHQDGTHTIIAQARPNNRISSHGVENLDMAPLNAPIDTRVTELRPGDVVCLLTDGIFNHLTKAGTHVENQNNLAQVLKSVLLPEDVNIDHKQRLQRLRTWLIENPQGDDTSVFFKQIPYNATAIREYIGVTLQSLDSSSTPPLKLSAPPDPDALSRAIAKMRAKR